MYVLDVKKPKNIVGMCECSNDCTLKKIEHNRPEKYEEICAAKLIEMKIVY
jgi:hypothetical protein